MTVAPARTGPHRGYSIKDLRALILAFAAERELALRREEAAYRRGLAEGAEATLAYQRGWDDAQAERDRSWRAVTARIAHPGREADRRVRDADAGSRADAIEAEDAFVRKAYNTHPRNRTDAQAAAVLAYPPPAKRRRRGTGA